MLSILRLEIIGERGEPMETPSTCSKMTPWKEKNVDLRQNLTKEAISSEVLRLKISMESYKGTLVNREMTSKLTKRSELPRVLSLIKSTKWEESLMKELELPIKGDKILARCEAKK